MRPQAAQNHPLSERHALERVVADLSRCAPDEAIGEIAPWIDSLIGNGELDFVERCRLLFALDEASQRPARYCVDLYLKACASSSLERRRLWGIAHGYWAMVLDAYGELLIAQAAEREIADSGFVAQLSVRAMRAASSRAKWDAFRHGPIDDAVWARLNLAYRLAVRAGVAELPVRLRPDREATSTVKCEYLRAIALHSVGLDQLDAERLELASRLVHYVLPRLELSNAPAATTLYWIDAAHSLPPARLVQAPRHAALPRFFGGVLAAKALQELLELASVGNLPAGFALLHDAEGSNLVSVLSHMIRLWSSEAPVRRHRRHRMPGRLLVVEGMERLLTRLDGENGAPMLRDWAVRDASLQGVGADAPNGDIDGVEVGSLIGMHSPDGDRWRIGAVRRLWRSSKGESQIGIELLGDTPVSVLADDGVSRMRVVLLDPLRRGMPVRLILPLSARCSDRPLYLLDQHKALKLVPLPGREFGLDHEIRTYLLAAA
ncbi:hypothetical protein Q9Q94_15850 [Uliginosibacterium sp. 31-16]|uniref:hypothetical protein n=1 Tax=Uliginosibacterium sp. 31-16 TaxID=3068315 RepID=UPI00273D2EE2|nr:hypothetical protein [Uliginosibacterium sp. 31-16]MDP5241014.1 hypothetical protein [Uliginosibacterium sp. 31-16]